MWFTSGMAIRSTRRTFLRAAPVAAAASLSLSNAHIFAAEPSAGTQGSAPPAAFQIFTAQALHDKAKALEAKPGNDNLFDANGVPVAVVLTVEQNKSAKEFEWHEGRDHVVQILDGATKYEVGGTPQGAHTTKPGEWLAPASDGSATLLLKKGDMLVIPRGTPHKRSTEGSVTFTLISSSGTLMS
jgi:quercetin dioxygenase-like cupin family protein